MAAGWSATLGVTAPMFQFQTKASTGEPNRKKSETVLTPVVPRRVGMNQFATIALLTMEFRMRVRCLSACVVFLSLACPAQDWQECKPTGDFSFNDVKAAVHRVTSSGMYSGWDEKTFFRSGDLVAVAVLKTMDDSEMASPQTAKWVCW